VFLLHKLIMVRFLLINSFGAIDEMLSHSVANVNFPLPNIYLGNVESLTPVVTNSLIDVRGEWLPNCDDKMLVSRLGIVFDRVEGCLEFHKRYLVYVGFSINSGSTRKNKSRKTYK